MIDVPGPYPERTANMPLGADRDECATCWKSGPGMRKGIEMQPKLKPVQTRDGSKPIIAGNDEGETDDVVRDPKPRSSHCNEPRDGAALDRSFIFDYINPMTMDATIRVTLTSIVGGEEHLLSEQTMMGNGATRNGVKRKLERPDLPAGDYILRVLLQNKAGGFEEDVQVAVVIV